MAFTLPTVADLREEIDTERSDASLSRIIHANATYVDSYAVPESSKVMGTLKLAVADVRYDALKRERAGDAQIEQDHANTRAGILRELAILVTRLETLGTPATPSETVQPNPTLTARPSAADVTLTVQPGGDTATIPGASGTEAGVMSAADKRKLDAQDTAGLATEAELQRLEAVVLTSTRVFGPQSVTYRTDRATYLGNLAAPALSFKMVANETGQGERTPQTVPAGALAALAPIPDAPTLQALAPANRIELPAFVDGDTALYLGRTESGRLVVQSAGSVSYDRTISVFELEPRRLTTNEDIRAVAGALVAAASWPDGGGATYANDALTIRIPTAGQGSTTALTVAAAAPSAPANGDLWSDTTADQLRIWNGTAWVAVGANPTRDQVYLLAKAIFQAGDNVAVTPDDGAETLTVAAEEAPQGLDQAAVDGRVSALVRAFALAGGATRIERGDLAADQRLPAPTEGQFLVWRSGALANVPAPSGGRGLTGAQEVDLNDAVQIETVQLIGRVLHLASADGTSKALDLPGLTVQNAGVRVGAVGTVDTLNAGTGLTLTRAGNTVTLNATEQVAGELEPLADLPTKAGKKDGLIVNVNGDLFELAEQAGNNRLHGTVAAGPTSFYGTSNIAGQTAVGAWVDPDIEAELYWAGLDADEDRLNEQSPTIQVRLPRRAFAGSPPAAVYVVLQASNGNVIDLVAGTRNAGLDTGAGTGSGATGVYGWQGPATGTTSTAQPGDTFVASVFSQSFTQGPIELHEGAAWELHSKGATNIPLRSDAQVGVLADKSVSGKLIAGSADGDLAWSTTGSPIDKLIATLKANQRLPAPDAGKYLKWDSAGAQLENTDAPAGGGGGGGATEWPDTEHETLAATVTLPVTEARTWGAWTEVYRYTNTASESKLFDFAGDINPRASHDPNGGGDRYGAHFRVVHRNQAGADQQIVEVGYTYIRNGPSPYDLLSEHGFFEYVALGLELAPNDYLVIEGQASVQVYAAGKAVIIDPVDFHVHHRELPALGGGDGDTPAPSEIREYVKSATGDGGTLTIESIDEAGDEVTETWTPPIPAPRTLAVDRLPAAGTAGRQVWVRADYVDDGVQVQPAHFAGTFLEGAGYGTRGYYMSEHYTVGSILGAWADLVLLSDTTLAVRHGSITPVTLHVGDQSYTLTAGNTNVQLDQDSPAADLYTWTGTLPAGDWTGVRIVDANGDSHPATVQIAQGEYLDTGTSWTPAGFNAPAGDTEHDFRLLAEETVPGTAATKAVAFTESTTTPSLYTAVAPFPGITSITFDGRGGQAWQNRYVVRLPHTAAIGGGAPARLMIGTRVVALTPAQVQDAGQAVYITPAMAAADRVTDTQLSRALDVGYRDGTWANGAGGQRVVRTIDKVALQQAATTVRDVTALPRSPVIGEKVNLLRPDTLPGFGILTAGLSADGSFAGWESSPPNDVGGLDGAPDNRIAIFGSYLHSGSALFHNRTVWVRGTGESRTPRYATINGRRYTVQGLGASFPHFFYLQGANSATIEAGKTYAVQFEYSNGDVLYADVRYAAGLYEWTGVRWDLAPGQWSQAQILAWFATWAQAGNADRLPLAKLPIIRRTQAQYDADRAAGRIDANTLYAIIG